LALNGHFIVSFARINLRGMNVGTGLGCFVCMTVVVSTAGGLLLQGDYVMHVKKLQPTRSLKRSVTRLEFRSLDFLLSGLLGGLEERTRSRLYEDIEFQIQL